MDLMSILADHGFGGNDLIPFFGDGSDGAFNPTGTESSTTQDATTGNYGTTSNLSAGATIINQFKTGSWGPETNVLLNSVSFNIASGNPAVGYLWDDRGNLLAQTPNGFSNNPLAFSTSVALQPNKTYYVGIRGTDGNVITVRQGQTTSNKAVTIGGVTLTLATDGFTHYGNVSPGVCPINGNTWSTIFFTLNVTVKTKTVYAFPSTQDGPPVVKQFTSINIPSGVFVTVSNRCKGLIMLCQGDITVDGTISMDGMAALADPTDMANNPPYAVIDYAKYTKYPLQTSKQKVIVIGPGGRGGDGGDGGSGSTTNSISCPGGKGGAGTPGTWWGGGRGGGGGGGGASYGTSQFASGGNGGDGAYTGTGTPGSSVNTTGTNAVNGNNGSGGAGGGGGASATSASGIATSGAGGSANGAGGGGGGGGADATSTTSPTASPGASSSGGAGGLILIIAKGNVTINSSGRLSAKGSPGANGGDAYVLGSGYAGGGGGGGGSGGGIIAILAKGAITNSGTTDVSGGVGGLGGNGNYGNSPYQYLNGQNGKNGGSGTVQLVQLS
jgi:hypothetical protein